MADRELRRHFLELGGVAKFLFCADTEPRQGFLESGIPVTLCGDDFDFRYPATVLLEQLAEGPTSSPIVPRQAN